MANRKKYYTDEERKTAKKENAKRWASNNEDKVKKIIQKYKKTHKYKISTYAKERAKTIRGRASSLISAYNMMDKKMGREHGNLTIDWIIENIFTKPCVHCGKSGWQIIGCNRLDDSKSHTMDNVEPCCLECNVKIQGEKTSKKVYQYTLDDEFVKIWDSTSECKVNGFSHAAEVARGERKQDKGYKFYYEPL